MRTLFLSWLFLIASVLSGQDASLLPGLRNDLIKAKNDTVRADALARICFNLIRIDPDSARIVGEESLALAKRIDNPRALGDAHNNLGWLAAEQGQFDRADSLLNIALERFRRMGDPVYTSVVLSNLGWLAEKRGDSVRSVDLFQQALRLSEQAKDTASSSILLYSLGVAYRKISEYEESISYLQRSLDFERILGRKGKEANCAVGLANTYKAQGDTGSARRAYEQALVLFQALNDHQGWGIVEENLGDLDAEKSPRVALSRYAQALDQYRIINSAIDKAYVLQRIGTVQVNLGELRGAESSLKEGLALSRGAGDPQLEIDYELALGRLYAKQGDGDAAITHFERHVFLKDSLQGADTQRELARLSTAFETERKEKDNVILRAVNNEQATRLRNSQVRLLASIIVAGLVLIAALLLLRNFLLKRKHAAALEVLNERLALSNTEISEMNGLLEMKLLRSQMNPHFIYNCLNSAAQMTQAGKSAEALAYLQGFARLLRMVLDHSVNDTVTVEQELDFLRQYLNLESYRLNGLHFTLTADPELIDDLRTVPALIVQPFVENAVWHGLANKTGERSLTVHFGMVNDTIRCTITDNGIGREKAAWHQREAGSGHVSVGMQLTSERLKLLSRRLGEKGAIRVDDLSDNLGAPTGTRVIVELD